MMGYPDQAARLSDESMAHAHADGHAFNLVWAMTFSAYVFAYRREPERFLERVGEADRLAREQGLTFIYEVSVPQARGIAELQNGRPREAISLLRQGIDRWTKTGGNVRIPLVKSALAEAVALEGDPGTALELINECIAADRSSGGAGAPLVAGSPALQGLDLDARRPGRRGGNATACIRSTARGSSRRNRGSYAVQRCSPRSCQGMATTRAARDLLAPVYGWFTEGAETKDLIEARELLRQFACSITNTSEPMTGEFAI